MRIYYIIASEADEKFGLPVDFSRFLCHLRGSGPKTVKRAMARLPPGSAGKLFSYLNVHQNAFDGAPQPLAGWGGQ